MSTILKKENNKCWQECRVKGTLIHYWWECKIAVTVRNSLAVSQKVKELPYDLKTTPRNILPKLETGAQIKFCTQMFTAALFTRATR